MEKKMNYKYGWKVDPYRRDKRTGVISPIQRSDYAQHLFDKGAGWSEQKTDRERAERLCLDDQ
ncbi:hypothetical protein [Virgibacillus halodenitrificans]|uniref:hypothetical protein n=1 Tax=Virgibacillus halodenitrificans TaxID=1482 RepID=UPI0013CE497B|nr:hypothetical protein [Virgibacillus halodenitrificans]